MSEWQNYQMKANDYLLIKPTIHKDHRGFFAETYSRKKYLEYGIDAEFVQDNHSISKELGTLRGLHFQAPPHAQAKIVRCGRGSIFDVCVDIRRGSPTYLRWEGFQLTPENGHQVYIPIGFAHGFMTLEPDSEIVYKCTNYYAPQTEACVSWNDPDIRISWPKLDKLILSKKDAAAPILEDFESPFIYGHNL